MNTGKDCIIPFTYENVEYFYCARIDGKLQCATSSQPNSPDLDECSESWQRFVYSHFILGLLIGSRILENLMIFCRFCRFDFEICNSVYLVSSPSDSDG